MSDSFKQHGGHLRRVNYQTDITPDDPQYEGTRSGFIPASAFRDGSVIVGVDWSNRGWVDVTFLSPGN